MSSRNNVVITGLGVISPLGIGPRSFWESLASQTSGIVSLPQFEEAKTPVQIGAPVRDFEPKRLIKPRKAIKVMCREIQLGFAAAAQAVEHGGLPKGHYAADRFGVVFGADMLYCSPHDMIDVYRSCIVDGQFDYDRWGAASMSEMYPLWMLLYLPNMIACHIGIAQDARGPNNTICQGDVSSLLAVIEAVRIVQRGDADVMLCGGGSSRLSVTPMVYRGYRQLSHNNLDPPSACRPFEADRDGLVNGEGAAAFLIERESKALERGAKPLARIGGWGITFGRGEAGDFTHVDAIARAANGCLSATGASRSDVGHLNAHAGGAVVGDRLEAEAIDRLLGKVPVTAPKSYFGTLGAAGGALELAVSLLAFQHGQVPPTLNYKQPDPACPVNVISETARPVDRPLALIQSQSLAGQAVALSLVRDL